jgi:hypothetical protein
MTARQDETKEAKDAPLDLLIAIKIIVGCCQEYNSAMKHQLNGFLAEEKV